MVMAPARRGVNSARGSPRRAQLRPPAAVALSGAAHGFGNIHAAPLRAA